MLPRVGEINLAHVTLEQRTIERLLEAPDVSKPLGLRDKAMLELQNAFCSMMGYLPLRGALEAPPVVLGLDKPGWLPAALFALVIVTPAATEFLFRGVIQQLTQTD